MTVSIKPTVPPRPRNITSDNKRIITISSNNSSSSNSNKIDAKDVPSQDSDLENIDCKCPDFFSTSNADSNMLPFVFLATSQLCSNLINQLMHTTTSVLQLHQRLKISEDSSSGRNNNLMLKELENAVIMTQTMLTKITNR